MSILSTVQAKQNEIDMLKETTETEAKELQELQVGGMT